MELLNFRFLIPVFFGMILLIQPITMGDFAFAQYLSPEELDKERIQLEKQRKTFEDNHQIIQSQIHELSSILNTLKTNNVSQDKIEDIEEQLEELYDDKSKLEESEIDLLEREAIFQKNWNDLSPKTSATSVTSESASIPSWFKNNAQWWKQGLISDSEIVNGIESLIIQDVIPLDNFIKYSSGIEHTAGVSKGGDFITIPSYQKDVFGYWSEGQVSDSEIISSIGYLMSEGIINSAKIQIEISEKQAKFDQKMTELDAGLDSDSKFMDKLDDDIYDTVINSDGSKTVTFNDESTTTFFKDGSRTTTFTKNSNHDAPEYVRDFYSSIKDWNKKLDSNYFDWYLDPDQYDAGVHYAPDGTSQYFTLDHEDESTTWISDEAIEAHFEWKDASLEERKEIIEDRKRLAEEKIQEIKLKEEESNAKDSGGGMQQMTPVTVLTIDRIQYPISQFTLWKWEGECNNEWHYHTNSGHAYSLDGVTGISDADQENCGFGTVSQLPASTGWMFPYEISNFKEVTSFDPLENEAKVGGSNDGSNPVDVNPGPVSIEESDSTSTTDDSSESIFPLAPGDWDGDGLPDVIDDDPYFPSTEFGTYGGGLPGEIIDRGDLTVTVSESAEGTVSIEVGTDGNSESVIIEIMGVELELTPGIYEFSFG